MILTNAVYFKGLWEEPFEKLSTKDRDFWTSSTKSITVPTMHKTDFYNYVQNDDAQILEIPYKGERFSMLIALPLQRDGIEDLENALKSDVAFVELAQVYEVQRAHLSKCTVFPRFVHHHFAHSCRNLFCAL